MEVDVIECANGEERQALGLGVSLVHAKDISIHTTSNAHKPKFAPRCNVFDNMSDIDAIV